MIEQVAWNESSLLLKNKNQNTHHNHLQAILKQKLLTKVIKNVKLESLDKEP